MSASTANVKDVNIEYSGYILLVAELTGASSLDFQSGLEGEVKCPSIQSFIDFCDRDRKDHFSFAEEWLRKEQLSKSLDNDLELDELRRRHSDSEEYLYRPKMWLSLDNPDKSLGLVLANRLDFAQELNSNIHVDSTKVTMSFCPTVSQFEPEKNNYSFLVSLESLFRNVDSLPSLQCYCKIRLNILSTLGPTLWIQKAIQMCILDSVRDSLEYLKSSESYKDICYPGVDKAAPFWNIDDVKVSVLDVQDWAELALLLNVHDLRISNALISAVSNLTVKDLVKRAGELGYEDALLEILNSESVSPHRSLCQIASSNSDIRCSGESLKSNHLLSKMYTTSGIAFEAYSSLLHRSSGERHVGKKLPSSKMFYPVLKFDCYEGHDNSFYDEIKSSFEDFRLDCSSERNGISGSWRFVETGLFDSAFYAFHLDSNNRDSRVNQMVSIPEFVQIDQKLKRLYGRGSFHQRSDKVFNIRQCKYQINVPVEEEFLSHALDVVVPEDHLYLQGAVKKITASAFGGELLKFSCLSEGDDAEKDRILSYFGGDYCVRSSKVDLLVLDNCMRILSIDSMLNREIISLFKSFCESLNDTYTSSSVIDLWDPFLNLYEFLVEKAGEMLTYKVQGEFAGKAFPVHGFYNPGLSFVEVDRDKLEEYLDNLKESLKMRMRDSLEREGTRLSSVSSRMASIQLLSATDGLIKTCGGVMKSLRRRQEGSFRFSRVGENPMFATLTSAPGMSVSHIGLGSTREKTRFQGASININLGHLTQVNALTSFVHEAGHLLYPFFRDEQEVRVLKPYEVNCEEIFCDQIVLAWVFLGEEKLFERSYFSSLRSKTTDFRTGADHEIRLAVKQNIDHLVRLYFVVVMTRFAEEDFDEVSICEDFVSWGINLIDEFLPSLLEGLEDGDRRKYLSMVFQAHYSTYATFSVKAWKFILKLSREEIFGKGEEDFLYSRDSEFANDFEARLDSIKESLEKGQAISRFNFKIGCGGKEYSDQWMDALMLVRCIVRSSTELLLAPDGLCSIRSFLARDEIGRISVEKSSKWNNKAAVLDARRCGYFSLSPITSERMLKIQIAATKSFWDISGFLKGRRFNDMISRANLESNEIS